MQGRETRKWVAHAANLAPVSSHQLLPTITRMTTATCIERLTHLWLQAGAAPGLKSQWRGAPAARPRTHAATPHQHSRHYHHHCPQLLWMACRRAASQLVRQPPTEGCSSRLHVMVVVVAAATALDGLDSH